MAKVFPNSKFTGYDISEEGISRGKKEAEEKGLDNANFEVRSVAELNVSSQYDLVTACDAIHDQVYPRKVLKGIAEALRPNGTFLMIDIAASSKVEENIEHPLGPLFYTISCMHCMTVSPAHDGEGLGTMWGEQKAEELLSEAGFTNVDVKKVEGDIQNNYYIATK